METNADMEADTDVDADTDVEVAMTPDPRAWRVAIALALALPEPPDWARWASGETADPRPATWWCTGCERDGAPDFGAHVPTWSTRAYCRVCIDDVSDPTMRPNGSPTPVPAPWDVPAYLADCARRGVEPGPLPSLEWTGPDGFGWKVCTSEGGSPYVEFTWCGDDVASWVSMFDEVEFYTDEDGRARVSFSREFVGRIVTLATAAAKAMVP